MNQQSETPPEHRPEIRSPRVGGESVWVDVYSWLEAIRENKGALLMVGAFRVANHLCYEYWPAILVTSPDEDSFEEERFVLSGFLRKEIKVLRGGSQFKTAVAWISIGVDHTCPHLFDFRPEERPHCIAVLHDTMSFHGVYGEKNVDRYLKGVLDNDAFAAVSKTSVERFVADVVPTLSFPCKPIIDLPLAHSYPEREWLKTGEFGKRRNTFSISVGSVYSHKNIFRELELANHYFMSHLHVGRFHLDGEVLAKINTLLVNNDFGSLEVGDDMEVMRYLKLCRMFICASLDEGFSLTPMEAILCGVPHIILSDIPAHREIYGKFNVNFVSPVLGDMTFPDVPRAVTEEDRETLYTTRTHEAMMRPLNDYISKIPARKC